MNCKNCGKENTENALFCIECGYFLSQNDKKLDKRASIIISIISAILCLPSITYCVWYFRYMTLIPIDNYVQFNILPILIINIFVLIFFMIKYRNIVAVISFVSIIVTLIIPPIMYILSFSGAAFLNCLGDLCTCGGIDGATPNKWNTDFLMPFEFIIKVK